MMTVMAIRIMCDVYGRRKMEQTIVVSGSLTLSFRMNASPNAVQHATSGAFSDASDTRACTLSGKLTRAVVAAGASFFPEKPLLPRTTPGGAVVSARTDAAETDDLLRGPMTEEVGDQQPRARRTEEVVSGVEKVKR